MSRKKRKSLDQLSKSEIWVLAAVIFMMVSSFLLTELGLIVLLLSRVENKLMGASLVAGILLISWIIVTNFHKLGRKNKLVVRGGRITQIADTAQGSKQGDWARLTSDSAFRPLLLAIQTLFFSGLSFSALVIALLANELLG